MTKFQESVVRVVQAIPRGTVVSYGQVAVYVGVPRAARQVGWVLRSFEGNVDLPWWRVINNAGRITIKGNRFNTADVQRKLIIAEGIPVSRDFTLDIEKFRFKAPMTLLNQFELPKDYIDMIGEWIGFSSQAK